MNTKVFFLEVTTGWFSEPGEIHNICRAWTLFALLAIWGEPRANIWWKCGQNKKENQVQPPRVPILAEQLEQNQLQQPSCAKSTMELSACYHDLPKGNISIKEI